MSKIRILIVDDQPKFSDLIRIILVRKHRFDVRVENHSVNALQSAQEFRPDLILLDVVMPGKDGAEVAREIEEDPALSGTPIILLTSLISPSVSGGRDVVVGGMRFLSKPLNPQALFETIDRVLGGDSDPAIQHVSALDGGWRELV